MNLQFLSIFLTALLLTGCGGEKLITEKISYEKVEAVFEVSTDDVDPRVVKRALHEAVDIFKNRLKITQGPGNELARLNQQRGPLPVSPEFYELLQLTVAAMTAANGAYNPRLTGLRRLFGSEGTEIRTPSESEINEELANIASTQIQLLEGSNVRLTGSAVLDLHRIGAAWALDAAADLMQQRGVKSARLSVLEISRFWGQPEPGRKWQFQVKAPSDDGLVYRIEPEDGALSVIQSEPSIRPGESKAVAPYFKPGTGIPADYCYGLAAWTGRAVEAAVYAEAMFALGRRETFLWLEGHPEATVLYFYPTELGFAAESEKRMSGWFNTYLP